MIFTSPLGRGLFSILNYAEIKKQGEGLMFCNILQKLSNFRDGIYFIYT